MRRSIWALASMITLSAACVQAHTYSVAKHSQTITFEALYDVTDRVYSISPTAYSSSGLRVHLESNSTDVCSVFKHWVRILNTGTCSITATQDGNDYFSPAQPITHSFEITNHENGATTSHTRHCPNSDSDSDNDGISDVEEGNVDTDNDGLADYLDADSDNDGLPDVLEGAVDTDDDGLADYLDLDSDNDGIPDVIESGFSAADTDNDGLNDSIDVDSTGGNDIDQNSVDDLAAAADSDADGTPDYLDVDSDNDGRADVLESGLGMSDSDNDQIVDMADPDFIAGGIDADNDGIEDTTALLDTDNDGIPDVHDTDSDGDTIPDRDENGSTGNDQDGDGIDDASDYDIVRVLDPTVSDANNDGIADDVIAIDTDNDNILDTLIPNLDRDSDTIPDYQDAHNDTTSANPPDGNAPAIGNKQEEDGEVLVSIATGASGFWLVLLLPTLALRRSLRHF